MRSSAAPAACVILALALLGALALPGAASAVGADPGGVEQFSPAGIDEAQIDPADNESLEPVNQTITIDLDDDGNATFTIAFEFSFRDDTDRAAFEAMAADFEEGAVDPGYTLDTFERIVDAVDDTTDRDHHMREGDRDWTATDEAGVLRLTFVWEGFATSDNDELIVDDAFLIGDETWLSSLDANQRLVIHPPPDYAVDRAPAPVGAGGTLVWEGPTEFAPGEIAITYVPTGTTPPVDDGEPPPDDGFDALTLVAAGLAVALIVALGVVIYLLRERHPIDLPVSVGPGTADAVGEGEGEREGVSEPGRESDRAGEREPGGAGANSSASAAAVDDGSEDVPAAGAAGAAKAGESDEPAEPTEADPYGGVDPELLSDEERVIRLLRANDGRMKQATIVKETRWSNAKVSQLLSGMADDGAIEKLRIGRENLITLLEDDDAPDGE